MLHWQKSLSREQFIQDYWQKKPALLKQAISPDVLALPADELAGLACDSDIEARLIHRDDHHWHLYHGPFEARDFAELPERDWTLLVQDVDKYVPEVADLLAYFDFIPDWRIDDIMISYATDQGGVGPHTDSYDVFLIQAQGKREWRISQHAYSDADLLDDCPIRVLRDFYIDETWVVEPGDILYLPPHVAHWGIAQGECMTWSLGLRGPSQWEIAQAWLAYQATRQNSQYFQDGLHHQQTDPNQINQASLQNAEHLIQQALLIESKAFKRWFGAYVTEAKEQFEIPTPESATSPEALCALLQNSNSLVRHPWARIALADDATLCFQGHCLTFDADQAAFLPLISRNRCLTGEQLAGYPVEHPVWFLLAKLVNQGLYFLEELV